MHGWLLYCRLIHLVTEEGVWGCVWGGTTQRGIYSASITAISVSSETHKQVDGRVHLDLVVGECAAIFQLGASIDEPLALHWVARLCLKRFLDVLYRR